MSGGTIKMLWTGAEIRKLVQHYPRSSWKQILEEIPRHSKIGIENKAWQLKIRRKGSSWAADEDKYLSENYYGTSKQEIMDVLVARTWEAIVTRAHELGVPRNLKGRNVRGKWSEKDIAYLTRNYHFRDFDVMESELGRSKSSIRNKAGVMGLKRDHLVWKIVKAQQLGKAKGMI